MLGFGLPLKEFSTTLSNELFPTLTLIQKKVSEASDLDQLFSAAKLQLEMIFRVQHSLSLCLKGISRLKNASVLGLCNLDAAVAESQKFVVVPYINFQFIIGCWGQQSLMKLLWFQDGWLSLQTSWNEHEQYAKYLELQSIITSNKTATVTFFVFFYFKSLLKNDAASDNYSPKAFTDPATLKSGLICSQNTKDLA